MSRDQSFNLAVKQLIRLIWVLIFCVIGSTVVLIGDQHGIFDPVQISDQNLEASIDPPVANTSNSLIWQAPDESTIPNDEKGDLIRYGKELIAHTSVYLGPKGKVKPVSNGMNCQNCHLQAGTIPYGNNYGRVASSYPKFRNRSGTIEGFEKRINGCFQRSLNGEGLSEDSKEMRAMVAYLKWVGGEVPPGKEIPGFGFPTLKPLDGPADPEKGKLVYVSYCARCHGENGEGKIAESGLEWQYPPLYGEESYNIGAGLFRVSRFATFVKFNMPFGVTYKNTFLTDEEAWHVAAFVNSMPRPTKDLSGDWPDISKKPVDHPFGPYADRFSENEHKYGPFPPLQAANN